MEHVDSFPPKARDQRAPLPDFRPGRASESDDTNAGGLEFGDRPAEVGRIPCCGRQPRGNERRVDARTQSSGYLYGCSLRSARCEQVDYGHHPQHARHDRMLVMAAEWQTPFSPASNDPVVRIGYVVSRFPHVTETFILRESRVESSIPERDVIAGID